MNPKPRKKIAEEGFKKEFAERLKSLREKKKMTVKELADKSGIPFQTIHRWESADRCPVNEQIFDVAKALEIKASKLIGEPKE